MAKGNKIRGSGKRRKNGKFAKRSEPGKGKK